MSSDQVKEDKVENVENVSLENKVDTGVSPLADTIIQNLESIYTGELSPLNIVAVATTAMQVVEKIPKLKGGQKKALVLSVIHKLAEKNNVDKSLLAIIPDVIDMAIAIQNGVTVIAPQVSKCCFSLCK
jgi:hypothetical protein